MKTLRALVLLAVVACPAFAGDMPNGVPSPEPQPTPGSVYTGDIQSGVTGDLQNPGDMPNGAGMTATVLTELLQVLLSLY